MTTPSGGAATYATLAAVTPGSIWLTAADNWMALSVWALTVAVLVVRLIVDWPKLRARLRRKGGG